MSTTFGLLDPPLGNMRLQVVRLFSALLHTHDSRIQKEIIINSTCTVLIVRGIYPLKGYLFYCV